jgi:hypothetical protein
MHGNVMFRGPRVKMGIYCGTPTRVIPHTTTGRADYFGPVVGAAWHMCCLFVWNICVCIWCFVH